MSIPLLLFAFFLILVGVASAAQSAFGYLNATRLRRLLQQGASRSQAMFEVVHNPGPFLSSIALLYTLSVAGVTAVVIDFIQHAIPDLLVRVLVGALGAVLVLVAQAIGRRIATARPEPVAARLYTPLRALSYATLPLVWPWYVL